MRTLVMTLRGMSCEHCVSEVRKAVESVAGVSGSRVEVNSARVTYDEAACRPGEIIDAVRARGGFEVVSFSVEKPT